MGQSQSQAEAQAQAEKARQAEEQEAAEQRRREIEEDQKVHGEAEPVKEEKGERVVLSLSGRRPGCTVELRLEQGTLTSSHTRYCTMEHLCSEENEDGTSSCVEPPRSRRKNLSAAEMAAIKAEIAALGSFQFQRNDGPSGPTRDAPASASFKCTFRDISISVSSVGPSARASTLPLLPPEVQKLVALLLSHSPFTLP